VQVALVVVIVPAATAASWRRWRHGESCDVDPVAYLRDVLLRIDTHPASRIDELLPDHWKPPPDAQADSAAA
jgi:hypothetical protein